MPEPKARQNLAGTWTTSADGYAWEKEVSVPGPLGKTSFIKRRARIDQPAGQTVMLWMDAPGLTDVIVNGHYARRHHHRIGPYTSLNITPWVKFGEENEFILPSCGNADPKIGIGTLELRFYPAGVYP